MLVLTTSGGQQGNPIGNVDKQPVDQQPVAQLVQQPVAQLVQQHGQPCGFIQDPVSHRPIAYANRFQIQFEDKNLGKVSVYIVIPEGTVLGADLINPHQVLGAINRLFENTENNPVLKAISDYIGGEKPDIYVFSGVVPNAMVDCPTTDEPEANYVQLSNETIENLNSSNSYEQQVAMMSVYEEFYHYFQRILQYRLEQESNNSLNKNLNKVNEFMMHFFQGLGIFDPSWQRDSIIPPFNRYIEQQVTKTIVPMITQSGEFVGIGRTEADPYLDGYLLGAVLRQKYPDILDFILNNPKVIIDIEENFRKFIAESNREVGVEEYEDFLLPIISSLTETGIEIEPFGLNKSDILLYLLKWIQEDATRPFDERTISDGDKYLFSFMNLEEIDKFQIRSVPQVWPSGYLDGFTLSADSSPIVVTTDSGRKFYFNPGDVISITSSEGFLIIESVSPAQTSVLNKINPQNFSIPIVPPVLLEGITSAGISLYEYGAFVITAGPHNPNGLDLERLDIIGSQVEIEGKKYYVVGVHDAVFMPGTASLYKQVLLNNNPDVYYIPASLNIQESAQYATSVDVGQSISPGGVIAEYVDNPSVVSFINMLGELMPYGPYVAEGSLIPGEPSLSSLFGNSSTANTILSITTSQGVLTLGKVDDQLRVFLPGENQPHDLRNITDLRNIIGNIIDSSNQVSFRIQLQLQYTVYSDDDSKQIIDYIKSVIPVEIPDDLLPGPGVQIYVILSQVEPGKFNVNMNYLVSREGETHIFTIEKNNDVLGVRVSTYVMPITEPVYENQSDTPQQPES